MIPATTVTYITSMIVRCSIDPCDRRHINWWRRHIDSCNWCDDDRFDRCDDDRCDWCDWCDSDSTIVLIPVVIFIQIGGGSRSRHSHGYCEGCDQSLHVRSLS
jgi:hypothetical protein